MRDYPILQLPEIFTLVFGVKIHKGLIRCLDPVLTKHARVRLTHKHLPQHVHAVIDVVRLCILWVTEDALALSSIIRVIPMRRLSEEIEAM